MRNGNLQRPTLNFVIENTSLDGFAYAITSTLNSNDHFEVLSESVFIEELPAGNDSQVISFDIKVYDDASIGTFLMDMDILKIEDPVLRQICI